MPDVTVQVNGRVVTVPEGTLVAAAVVRAGEVRFRRSVRGQARGPLCGMGICFECRARVDGVLHVRTCQLVCAAGMEIVTDD